MPNADAKNHSSPPANQMFIEAFHLANFNGDNDQKVTRNELESAQKDWKLRLAQLIHTQQLGFDKQFLIDNLTKRLDATQYLLDHFDEVRHQEADHLTHQNVLGITL